MCLYLVSHVTNNRRSSFFSEKKKPNQAVACAKKKNRVFLGVVVPRTTTFFELINSKKNEARELTSSTQGVDFVTQGLVIKKFNNVVIELDSERIKLLKRFFLGVYNVFLIPPNTPPNRGHNRLIKKKSDASQQELRN